MRPWIVREAPKPATVLRPWQKPGYWSRVNAMTNTEYWAEVDEALWAGDRDWLDLLAPCACCCYEHTFADCPARHWNGCRSGLEPGETYPDHHAWARWYAEHRGMTEEEFYGRPKFYAHFGGDSDS